MNCPCCNSVNIIERRSIEEIELFGIKVEYSCIINTCLTCKEQGDFFGANDNVIEAISKEVKDRYIKESLIAFEKIGYSHAALELELLLPMKTLTIPENRDLSAALLWSLRQTGVLFPVK